MHIDNKKGLNDAGILKAKQQEKMWMTNEREIADVSKRKESIKQCTNKKKK